MPRWRRMAGTWNGYGARSDGSQSDAFTGYRSTPPLPCGFSIRRCTDVKSSCKENMQLFVLIANDWSSAPLLHLSDVLA